MRVLTVRQPWAWAIIYGGKTVENRTRYLGDYRGPVAIHAALKWSDLGAEDWNVRNALCGARQGYRADDSQTWAADSPERDDPEFQFGAVIGTVHLYAAHAPRPGCCSNRGGAAPYGDPWAMDDHWHLCLSHPESFADPIPAKGRLGLWRPDHELADALAAARAALSQREGEL